MIILKYYNSINLNQNQIMNFIKILFVFALCLSVSHWGMAQAGDDRLKEIKEASEKEHEEGWISGGGLGLDLSQLALINPRVGAGQARIGFGALGNLYANYKNDKIAWDNSGSIQLAIQRLGNNEEPFQKNLDLLRLASRVGLIGKNEKLRAALEVQFETSIFKTYSGNLLSGDEEDLLSEFLSPFTLVVSPGVDYVPNDKISVFYSPFALKLIYVANDDIAALNVHGNELDKNSFLQLGSNLKVVYNDKFASDRVSLVSTLELYSNYRNNPQNIDVLWQNDLGVEIFKNLSLNLVTELFYDHDILVQVKDDNGNYSENNLGRRVSFTEALLIKYNFLF